MLRLYNRIHGKFEKFKPLENSIKIFVCGPTLYDDLHLGHLRVLLIADLINRYFRFKGYETIFVINFTDMDIKIIERAIQEKIDENEIVERYFRRINEDLKVLGIKHFIPIKPSELSEESKRIIQDLMKKGYSYELEEGIYCDISLSNNIGKLSGIDKQRILNVLLEPAENKRNPADFKLWYSLKDGEINTSFGRRMIGWHLQDFTVINYVLGGYCDLHIGAKDLIFPHHEYILTLGEYFKGEYPVSRNFLHTGLLKFKGEKMSKSLGNTIYFREIIKKYDVDDIRIYFLSMKINKDYNFDQNKLKYYKKIKNKLKKIKINKGEDDKNIIKRIIYYRKKFLKNIENNLNVRKAIENWIELRDYAEKKNLGESAIKELRTNYSIFSSITGILEDFRIE